MIPLGAMVEYHPSSPRDQMRIHQFGKKVLPGIFLGYELIAGEVGKEIFSLQSWKVWKMEASEIYLRRINAKEVLMTQEVDEFIFPVVDSTAKLSGRDFEFRESTLRREPTVRSEDLSGEIQGESGESQPADTADDAEARTDFWSIQVDFVYRLTINFMCRRKKLSLFH